MFEVLGYYDEDFRGLAESETTQFEDIARNIAWDYANKGYCVEIITPDNATYGERYTPDQILEMW